MHPPTGIPVFFVILCLASLVSGAQAMSDFGLKMLIEMGVPLVALIILVIGAIILVKCRTAGICCYDRPLMNVSEAEVSPFYTAPAPHYSHNDVEAVPLLPSEAATGYIVYNPAGQNPNFPPSQ